MRRIWGFVIGLALLLIGVGTQAQEEPPGATARNILQLFSEELQQAVVKLKWRGERLTDDTVYAIALTGLSWESAWGKDPLFSLGGGELKKAKGKDGKPHKENTLLKEEVHRQYSVRQYDSALRTAEANFSPEEIACDPLLKDAIGYSLLASDRAAEALEIFTAPFDASKLPEEEERDFNRRFREGAMEAAQNVRQTRRAVAFALSLALEPGDEPPTVHRGALTYLERVGVDIERVMVGILQAPDRLPGLPHYTYAAADILASRPVPRLLPFLMHLAQSDDVHLRSRAILALGLLAYRAHPSEPAGVLSPIISTPLREFGLSSSERKLIEREVKEAVNSDRYRLRTAATVALALMGDEAQVPLLQKMVKDKAYVLSEPVGDKKGLRRILFPVRLAACVGLARFGITAESGCGEFAGKALDQAKRGGQDVTDDRRGMRHDRATNLLITPVDVATLIEGQ